MNDPDVSQSLSGVKMQIKRLKIIPDRVFHKLWNHASNMDENTYISSMSSDKSFPYKRYGLDYVEAVNILKRIHKYRSLSFKDIAEITGTKKSEISHIFCIPIRTVEDWYGGISNPPSYILLMMLKYFHLLDLGKYVRLQSSMDFYMNKPGIYEKHRQKESDVPEDNSHPVPSVYYKEYMESDDYENYLDRLVAEVKQHRQ